MAEAYLYYKGTQPHAGDGKEKTDYTGNITSTWGNQLFDGGHEDRRAGGLILATTPSHRRTDSNTGAPSRRDIAGATTSFTSAMARRRTALRSQPGHQSVSRSRGGDTSAIPPDSERLPGQSRGRVGPLHDRSAAWDYRRLHDRHHQGNDRAVAGWTALLKSVAESIGWRLLRCEQPVWHPDPDASERHFSKIQSVNSVFASVSFPVSVNTSGTYLNQVYVGMFRPDAERSALGRQPEAIQARQDQRR